MRFPVEYRGQEAGFVEATQDIHGIQFEATCTLHTQEVVRLYTQVEERHFKIGVLEPEDGVLRLKRLWTPETLRSFQITELPRRYYIDDGRPGCAPQIENHTTSLPQDPHMLQAVEKGAVWQADAEGGWLRAPFDSQREQPLAFVLTACEIQKGADGYVAAFHWKATESTCKSKNLVV